MPRPSRPVPSHPSSRRDKGAPPLPQHLAHGRTGIPDGAELFRSHPVPIGIPDGAEMFRTGIISDRDFPDRDLSERDFPDRDFWDRDFPDQDVEECK